jgi:hypothetical protein
MVAVCALGMVNDGIKRIRLLANGDGGWFRQGAAQKGIESIRVKNTDIGVDPHINVVPGKQFPQIRSAKLRIGVYRKIISIFRQMVIVGSKQDAFMTQPLDLHIFQIYPQNANISRMSTVLLYCFNALDGLLEKLGIKRERNTYSF